MEPHACRNKLRMRSFTFGKLYLFDLCDAEPTLRARTHTNYNMPEVHLVGHLNR